MMPELLARSAWPRFGGDTANRSNAAVAGPHALPTLKALHLPNSTATRMRRFRVSGVVVAPDSSLRICHAGMLSAWTSDFSRLWQLDLAQYAKPAKPRGALFGASLPTALADGSTLIVLPTGLLHVAGTGAALEFFRYEEHPDDSGMSPNTTNEGRPLLSSLLGSVSILTNGQWETVADRGYGYDLVCPAVYADGSLAIAGYYGAGFCRVDLDGSVRWRTDLREADLLPTVNVDQMAAVGSLNDQASLFFAPDGSTIGRYPRAAVFASYRQDWIALSRSGVARVTQTGEELWNRPLSANRMLSGIVQPVVDADGYIYVRHDEGVLCCAGDGTTIFDLALPTILPSPVSLIAPGVLALIEGTKLFYGAVPTGPAALDHDVPADTCIRPDPGPDSPLWPCRDSVDLAP